ncbi:single-strand selective monofunctional uracil DNA glycosylase [Helicoverpa zea]|uniref:single-strand selective monofunctional uracil DNA glycosylase n=1 Tax=Helicoverpa zea TaxID=7113 RepID=UPI001F594306|nr:single-strand selective monofunctional uracil DNA glycosylase [Helicoverpa zea]
MEPEVVSSFFCNTLQDKSSPDISEEFLNLADELNLSLEQFEIPKKVEAVYNPTIYARETFEMYVKKYCNSPKPIIYFGMNPGPYGMSQTGVPFGEINAVSSWLGITGPVNKPPSEIKARPVLGFKCTRSEISGKRFWGLFKNLCGTPDNFFKSSFVYNYLPQQWMTKSGCNVTPGEFKKGEIQELYNICDRVFSKVLELYKVEKIVAIGKFCETRAKETLKKYPSLKTIQIFYLPHPSPRVLHNNNWDETATKFLQDNNFLQYYEHASH